MAKEEEIKTPAPIENAEEAVEEAKSVDEMIEEAPATTSNETQEYLRNLIKNATK